MRVVDLPTEQQGKKRKKRTSGGQESPVKYMLWQRQVIARHPALLKGKTPKHINAATVPRATSNNLSLHRLHHTHRRPLVPARMLERAVMGSAIETEVLHHHYRRGRTSAKTSRLPLHHTHTWHHTSAVIAALAANAVFARDLARPRNAAFTRRQRSW